MGGRRALFVFRRQRPRLELRPETGPVEKNAANPDLEMATFGRPVRGCIDADLQNQDRLTRELGEIYKMAPLVFFEKFSRKFRKCKIARRSGREKCRKSRPRNGHLWEAFCPPPPMFFVPPPGSAHLNTVGLKVPQGKRRWGKTLNDSALFFQLSCFPPYF